ncbi:MAG: hypothetical protein HKM03_04850 [Steroidobacteraceae bacterium]|nr:hypothetical protein [Steroidobacteraceae bacterium]
MRHINVMPLPQMRAGESYVGWLCKNRACGLVIAISPQPAAGQPAAAEFDDPLSAIKCLHCGNEDLYRWSARGEHLYSAGSPSP